MRYTSILLVFGASIIAPGVDAQRGDSIAATKSNKFERAISAPVILIAAGLSVKGEKEIIQKHFRRPDGEPQNPPLAMHIADYTQYAPIVLVYGLNLAGNKGEHTYLKSLSMLIQSEALMVALVQPLKRLTKETRPDGGSHSFPSGHTAQAFLAADILTQGIRS